MLAVIGNGLFVSQLAREAQLGIDPGMGYVEVIFENTEREGLHIRPAQAINALAAGILKDLKLYVLLDFPDQGTQIDPFMIIKDAVLNVIPTGSRVHISFKNANGASFDFLNNAAGIMGRLLRDTETQETGKADRYLDEVKQIKASRDSAMLGELAPADEKMFQKKLKRQKPEDGTTENGSADQAMIAASRGFGTEDRTCLPDRQGPMTNDQGHQSLVFGLWSEDDSAMLGDEPKNPLDDGQSGEENWSDQNGREQEGDQEARSDDDGGDFAFIDELRAKDFDELFNPDDDGETPSWMPQEPSADAFILPTAQTLFEQAKAAKENGFLDQALDYLEGALEEFPEFAAAYGLQGNIYAEQNKYEKAIEAYTKALAIEPENAWYHSGLGNAYRRIKKSDWNSAIRHLELAKQYDPGNVDHYINLSEAYRKQGTKESCEKALVVCRLAERLFPESADVYCAQANAYYDLGRFNMAESLYRRAVEIDPENSVARANLGIVLKELKKFNEALAECQRAERCGGDYIGERLARGFSLIELGHPEAAVKVLKKAANDKPIHPSGYL